MSEHHEEKQRLTEEPTPPISDEPESESMDEPCKPGECGTGGQYPSPSGGQNA